MAYYGEEMAYEGDLLEGVPELFEDPFAKQFGPEVPQPLWTLAEARDRLRGMPGVKVRAPALRPRRLRRRVPPAAGEEGVALPVPPSGGLYVRLRHGVQFLEHVHGAAGWGVAQLQPGVASTHQLLLCAGVVVQFFFSARRVVAVHVTACDKV